MVTFQAKSEAVFLKWVEQLKGHRLYRQHLLTFGPGPRDGRFTLTTGRHSPASARKHQPAWIGANSDPFILTLSARLNSLVSLLSDRAHSAGTREARFYKMLLSASCWRCPSSQLGRIGNHIRGRRERVFVPPIGRWQAGYVGGWRSTDVRKRQPRVTPGQPQHQLTRKDSGADWEFAYARRRSKFEVDISGNRSGKIVILRMFRWLGKSNSQTRCPVGHKHKSHDPCFYEKYMETGGHNFCGSLYINDTNVFKILESTKNYSNWLNEQSRLVGSQ